MSALDWRCNSTGDDIKLSTCTAYLSASADFTLRAPGTHLSPSISSSHFLLNAEHMRFSFSSPGDPNPPLVGRLRSLVPRQFSHAEVVHELRAAESRTGGRGILGFLSRRVRTPSPPSHLMGRKSPFLPETSFLPPSPLVSLPAQTPSPSLLAASRLPIVSFTQSPTMSPSSLTASFLPSSALPVRPP